MAITHNARSLPGVTTWATVVMYCAFSKCSSSDYNYLTRSQTNNHSISLLASHSLPVTLAHSTHQYVNKYILLNAS